MDEGMSGRMASVVLLGPVFALAAMPSGAQALADPTRPPSVAGLAVMDSGGGASGPVLQSILLSSKRRLAVIDGRVVKVGDRIGEARIVAIDYDSVKISDEGGISVMKLLPDAQKEKPKSKAVSSVRPRQRSEDESR